MGIGRSRVSTIVLQRGATLQRLADGVADITTGTYERAMQWFSDHWPDGADWPQGIDRPPPDGGVAPGDEAVLPGPPRPRTDLEAAE